ncbi:MAG TPA: GAF domain-containing protein, partial [Magnetococcales bacterium]|nr:GAF domain-containing protein [Magnetococcales bacterium]
HFVVRFIHDRVQQAAYHLIDAPSREKVHLTVGRLLLAEKGNEPLSGNLLRITDHLNLASRIIVVPGERLQLAKLNLQAGRQAKASAAFAPAFAYFTMGLTLLEDQVWNDHYGLMSNLYQEAVEGALLIADMDEMERLAGIALEHMIDVLDRAKLLKAKAIAYQGVNRLTESLAYGLEALAGLGFHFSDNPGVDEVRKSVFGGLARIEGKSIAELVAIPETTDPKYLVVMDLMVITGVTAFFIKQNLAPIIHIKGFELIFDHGAAPSASVLFAGCGVFLAGEGYYEEAYKLGQIALRLVERPNARQHLARTLQYSSGFTIFWKEHVHLAVHNINRVFDIAVENGQLDVAGLGGGGRTWHGFLVGFPLEEAERKAGHYNDALRKIKQFYVLDQARSTQQAMQNLLGQSDEPHVLAGRVCDGSQVLDSAIQLNNRQNAFAIALNQLILAYLFGKYEEALVHALQADIYMDGSPGSYSVTVFTLYDALTRLALVSISPPEVCEKLFARVAFHQQRMARWADMAPMNFAHKYHLIEAEKLRVMDRGDVARDHYDRAILLAHEHGFLNEEALALELAGCFYQGRKWTSLARHYMREARHAYACWGALAKVRDLEARFPEYLADHGVTVTPRATITLSTKTTTASLLDLPDVMMAAKVLFSETSLDVLLEKLMRLAIGNAGAQKGILVLLEEGVPVVKVEAVTERVRLLPSLSLEAQGGEAGIVAEEIVRYLLRTKENVVLDNACVEGIFAAVPYVASRKIRSVLGVPLVHHDQAIGAIYLENNLTTAAFTHQRVAMLHLIGTLAALSITNAQYVARQKKTQDSLAVSYQRIRELAAHQEEVREAEKRRIAGEIHDELGSALTRLSMDLHWLQRHPPKDKKKMGTHFDGLMGLTADIHETVRRISHTLRPPVLDQFGLLPALQWLAEQMQRHGNLKVEVTTDSQEVILDDQRKTTMFRIGQEALTNVVRHAHAQRAVISLELEEDAVVMVIRDDGIGISLDLIQKGGFGLSGMKERALRFGGNVEIETGSQGGTRVTVLLPRLESDHVEK